MHLTIRNIIKSWMTGGYDKHPHGPDHDDHTYIRGDIEQRGPCPGLNALANQGYL